MPIKAVNTLHIQSSLKHQETYHKSIKNIKLCQNLPEWNFFSLFQFRIKLSETGGHDDISLKTALVFSLFFV